MTDTTDETTEAQVAELERQRRVGDEPEPTTGEQRARDGETPPVPGDDGQRDDGGPLGEAAAEDGDSAPSASGESIPSSVDADAAPADGVDSDETAASSGAETEAEAGEGSGSSTAAGGVSGPLETKKNNNHRRDDWQQVRKTMAFAMAGAIALAVLVAPMVTGQKLPASIVGKVWPILMALMAYATGGDLAGMAPTSFGGK